ncbi:hypothetical protein B7463_g10269, partial [Scytalidium lignicola]
MTRISIEEWQKPMPIAIVGMSCRLPGDVSTLEDFWQLMSRARCGWSEIPKERFNKEAYYHPNPEKKGCFNTIGGYFLNHDLSKFDAPFFNITQQEAIAMDPQQRQLLECTYEAFENAGIPKESIAGRKIGVFVGGGASDYHLGNVRDLDSNPMFDQVGTHLSIQSGRISYYFDLRGPSITLDSACSSSLSALHQAVRSIRAGESEQAIVGACHLHLQPDEWVSLSTLGLLSGHGKTYMFDHRAKSGFARGEGVGCLILKPLHQAIHDNDKIWSVIVNTGVNQDGKTVGISTPSRDAQEQLMREVYVKAGISPEDVGFVEAHGTGTKVGDPIEAAAIYNVFGKGRTPRQPLYVGSVKTNVGHLENASGIISVIKAALMLDKGFILPNVNFEEANEKIPLSKWNMKVPTSQKPWSSSKRFISVNNFGFGGSNAHCVLEKAPFKKSESRTESGSNLKLFVLSGNDEMSAKASMKDLGIFLEQHPEVFQNQLFRNLAYTLCQRRSHLGWRLALVASSSNQLSMVLNSPNSKPTRVSKSPKVAFVFTGQGAQWYAMGRELLHSHHTFASTMTTIDEYLKCLGADFSIIDELQKDKEASQVSKAHISQPICTALQLALTTLLNSWGVRPMAVTGHSSGEIAAAYATGALSLEEAVAIAYYRGQAVLKMKEKHPDLRGSMLAVGASPSEAKDILKLLRKTQVVIACENSPGSITASGDAQAIDEFAAELDTRAMFNRKLRVDVAYHSPHMKFAAEDYLETIKDITPFSNPKIAFYSSVYGSRTDGASLGASYWVDNLTNPVLFSTSLHELCTKSRPDILVEIGPHSALEGPIKQILTNICYESSLDITYLPSLSRDQNATTSALKLAGSLYMKGHVLNFAAINHDDGLSTPKIISDLTPYPWSHQKYWNENRMTRQHRNKPFGRHDILGSLMDSSNDLEPSWRNMLRTNDIPWLRQHKMQSLTTFPLAGYICMVVEAAIQRASMRNLAFDEFSLREVQVSRPLCMEDDTDYETLLTLRPYADGTQSRSNEWDEFRIFSCDSSRGWIEHCSGLVAVRKQEEANPVNNSLRDDAGAKLEIADERCGTIISPDSFYADLHKAGASYGSLFQNTSGLRACDDSAVGQVEVPETATSMPSGYETPSTIQIPFIDLMFQFTFAILGAGLSGMKSLYVPSAIKELQFSKTIPNRPAEKLHMFAHTSPGFSSTNSVDFSIYGLRSPDSDEAVVRFSGLRMTPVKDDTSSAPQIRDLCFKLQWENLDLGSPPSTSTTESSGLFTPNSSDEYLQESNTDKHSNGRILSNTAPDSRPVVIISNRNVVDPFITSLIELISLHTGKTPSVSSLIATDASDKVCICLCELDDSVMSAITPKTFKHLQDLIINSSALLWVTLGAYKNAKYPERSMALGLLRTVRSETGKSLATLDLDPDHEFNIASQVRLIAQAFGRSLLKGETMGGDMEFSEENGRLLVPRIVEDQDMNLLIQRETQPSTLYLQDFKQNNRRLKLSIGTTGALDTLYFQDEEVQPIRDDEIEIQVEATGMNFKDVVIAMGQVSSPYVGVECSGTVSKVGVNVTTLRAGDRVCAMTLGAYSTFARCPAASAVRIPDGMTLEVGASIPVTYCTAYYAIMDLAHLCAGEKILIHAAAGGVGQAAIQLAEMIGAEIYATVGSHEKKQLIMDKYGIPEDHVFYSRSTAFGSAIREATRGEGVDVVINSLAGEFLRETWDCIAHFGRFIEIGKRDITSNTRLEMRPFEHNATFSSVDLTVLAAERPRIMSRVFTCVMELLSQEKIHPIVPITVMGISEVETALRMLQSGKTSGKVVIVPRPGEQVKTTHLRVNSGLLLKDVTYVIVGGTGGLGRSMTKWMVQKGAKHIVLLSRNGEANDKVRQLIRELGSVGARVEVRACDIANAANVNEVIAECERTLPPIRGVIHAAMVLRDMLFEKMGFEDFDTVVKSKVSGAWNIHNSLLNTNLDFFIVLSSVAGIVGNRGQAAYAAANTFLDAFVRYRIRNGLPAAAIDLTAVEGVGYLADNAARQTEILHNLSGNVAGEAELLALLTASIDGAINRTCNSQCITGLNIANGKPLPYYASDAKFSYLCSAALEASEIQSLSASEALSIQESLQRATSPNEAMRVITNGLIEKLSTILMVPQEDMDPIHSVSAYGLDSLNAIELRNWISKELQVHMQVLELLTSGTLTNLASVILKKTKITHA